MFPFGRPLRVARSHWHMACGWLAYRLGWYGASRRQYERVLLLRGACFGAYVRLGRIAFDLGDYAGWRREFEHARRTDPVKFARLRHPMELFEPRLAGTQCERPAGLRPGFAADGHGFEATDARATWRSLHPFGNDGPHGGVSRDGFGRSSDQPLAPDFDPLMPGQQLDDPAVDDVRPSAGTEPPQQEATDTQPERRGRLPGERQARPPQPSMPDASLHHDDFASAAERNRFQLRRPIDRHEIRRCNLDDLARRLIG